MRKFKMLTSVLLAVLMVASVFSFASCGEKKGYTANNTKFIIGCSGPLTGGAALYGNAVNNGASLAVEEINAAGGLNGVMFEFVMTDDKHDPANVSTNYSSMLEKGMQVSLGCVTTKPGNEFTNLSNEDNLFFITPSASGDNIAKYPNGYQMCFADSNQGVAAADYVNGIYKGQTIGVLYRSDDDYSVGIFEKFKASLDSSITLLEAPFQGESITSFETQINLLKDCKFIFMPIYTAPASTFMVQAKDTVAPDAVYYGCDGLDGVDTVEGFDINSIPQEVSYLSHFNSMATEGPAYEFIQKYTAKYGTDTLNQFAASAYDCVYAIYGAMKNAVAEGKTIDVTIAPSDLCEILKGQFDKYVFTGVTGKYEDGVQSTMTWTNGYVNKTATKYVVKAADNEAE